MVHGITHRQEIPERFRNVPLYEVSVNAVYLPHYKKRKIIKIEKEEHKKTDRYDIETGTHNYFANDILVHNCNI